MLLLAGSTAAGAAEPARARSSSRSCRTGPALWQTQAGQRGRVRRRREGAAEGAASTAVELQEVPPRWFSHHHEHPPSGLHVRAARDAGADAARSRRTARCGTSTRMGGPHPKPRGPLADARRRLDRPLGRRNAGRGHHRPRTRPRHSLSGEPGSERGGAFHRAVAAHSMPTPWKMRMTIDDPKGLEQPSHTHDPLPAREATSID